MNNNTFIIIRNHPDERDGEHIELLDQFPRWDRRDGERWFVANINGGDAREITPDEDADWIDGSR